MIQATTRTGFTLIELILTIVLFAIVGVMGVSFFSSGVMRTDIPLAQLQADAQLQLVLENMIADKEKTYPTDLPGFNNVIGNVNSTQSTYGNGNSYYITEKRFVCPNASNGFENNATANQFLLVTIKSNVNAGASLSYLFSSNSGNCNVSGS
jgi:prepilin-type N-terminal cleavage/methylation domain-containing protein